MLDRFIDTFTRAVAGEMESMRQRMGPYETPVDSGAKLDSGDESIHHYSYRLLQGNDKLVQGGECNLVTERGDDLVTVLSIEGDRITLSSPRSIDPSGRATLVIYPWFLYERLQETLRSLRESEDGFHVDTALALFGKADRRQLQCAPAQLPASLNDSQRQAVQLCGQVTPAFVWGPPGTGKTTTLGHIITSLLDRGARVLVTSTTNAAVDQALERLAALPSGQQAIQRGDVVRLGQTQAETHGAGLREVVEARNQDVRDRLGRLEARRNQALQRAEAGRGSMADMQSDTGATQMGLFGSSETDAAAVSPAWEALFGPIRVAQLTALPAPLRLTIVERRVRRLESVARLCAEKRQQLRARLRGQESVAVDQARLVLATMTNVYMSSLMEQQRFDVVVVEEAGMAILPTLFYCACLGSQQSIMVGDPQQLPPIVQSSQPFVHRAMGRSIFQITVPEPHASDLVVMLDTQYRMHPVIGELVGGLFYGGRLQHGDVAHTDTLAAAEPFPGRPLVVVDTAGSGRCERPGGSHSRYNDQHALIAVDLARRAVEAGADSVAIITPYAEQARRITRQISTYRDLTDRVECRTVHRFQGGERDVVIFDTVDAEPLPPGRLLSGKAPNSTATNLINVSLSRARGKLIILADVAYLRRHDPSGVLSSVLAAASRDGTLEILP